MTKLLISGIINIIGMPASGKSTLLKAVSSTWITQGERAGNHRAYRESLVQVGFDEASVTDLPSIQAMYHVQQPELATLQLLLWGNHPLEAVRAVDV